MYQDILDAYRTTTEKTLAAWERHPGVGEAVPEEDNRRHLGVSSGCLFQPRGQLSRCHQKLQHLASQDALLDVTPLEGLHFTFLALAWDYYSDLESLPLELSNLKRLYKQFVVTVDFRVDELRLVPLNNTLLLAGVPSVESYQMRQAFAEALLASPWRPHIEDRYKNHLIPPLFWHTTLARYRSSYASQALRELYFDYSNVTFGSLDLGKPQLVATTCNWIRFYDLICEDL